MTARRRSILLMEDDPNLGFILSEHLEMNGFAVTLCADGESGLAALRKGGFALVIADVMMPKKDGFSAVRELRRTDRDTPVIFLTARSLKEDRIEGLTIGADDYVTKPFSMEELLLRIHAVLRRSSPSTGLPPPPVVPIGKYSFDTARGLLTGEGGSVTLTAKEAAVLGILAAHLNRPVPRDTVLAQAWGSDTYYNARSMDVYITKLRKHLRSDRNVSIVNTRGVGYTLRVVSDVAPTVKKKDRAR